MKTKSKNNSVSYFDMQFITSSISTTLVLLLLGLVVFFVLTAHNLSVYVKDYFNFSIIISDDLKLYYFRGLHEWRNEKGYLRDTCLMALDRFKKVLDYFRIAYQGKIHGET